jgi:WD40 repeat protein
VKQPSAILEFRGRVTVDDYVADIAWSPESSRLAVAGGEGNVYLATRQDETLEARQIGTHGMGALAVAWRPRGEHFVSSGQDSRLVLFDGQGEKIVERRPSMSWTQSLAWSPDGSQLATAAGKQVSLWSPMLESGPTLAPLEATIAALGWDKPGRDLAAAINGGLAVQRIEPPRFPLRHYKWNAPCLTAAFSPNGRFLATGTQDGSVHFWHLSTGRDSQMRGYPAKVEQTVWSGDSRYLATAADDQVVIWDFGGKGPEGSRPQQLRGHTDRIECLAFQPNGNFLVSGGRDWRVSLWLPGKSPAALDAQLADSEPSCLRWSPDGRFVALGERRGTLSVFELVRLV